MKKNFLLTITGLALSCAVINTTLAEGDIIDAGTIEKSLMPDKDLIIENNVQQQQFEGVQTRQFTPTSSGRINLTAINFEFDSDVLTQTAVLQLEQLAIALKSSNLQEFSFDLIGHTDAKGSDSYNQSLSDRRASSVYQYLVNYHGIQPRRINAYGMGEKRLISADPYAAENRRVEIITQ